MQKVARMIYLVFVSLFLIGVMVQVFLAGMVVVAARMGWNAHIGLGHSLGLLLIIMLISMYLGKMPVKGLTWLLFGVYVLQADVLIFLRASVPVLSALHPVMALFDFALGVALFQQARQLARTAPAPSTALPGVKPLAEK